MNTPIHVYPLNDEAAHVLEGKACPCGVRVETKHNTPIVIHRSWDGRELTETPSAPKGNHKRAYLL